MAVQPTTNKPAAAPAAPAAPATKTETKNETKATKPAFSFKRVEAVPTAVEINAVTNPFQEEVNYIHLNGGASSVVVADEDVKATREMIRRACATIKMGAHTRVMPVTEGEGKGTHSTVYFSVKEQIKRTRKNA